jgi:16S rRNA (guanine(966)-N(2))-methyltransferase RsmD
MRIIAGEHRGRTIAAPPGLTTRPTPDRVRGALFSALESRLGGPGSLEGVRVLDLFAGSGALGLEALSRGAAQATFVERDRAALKILEANLATLGLAARARVLPEDAVRAVQSLAARGERFDAVLMDPPYGAPEALEALSALGEKGVLRTGGVLVFEHASTDSPPDDAHFHRERTRSYGTVALTVYVPEA